MTSLLTEVFVVWAELLLLWRASSPSREDWGRRTMRGNCIKTWQITVPTHCYGKSKKSENTGLVPLYLPDCHVGESMDSNNLTLQPSAKLVVLMYNQFKFYKKTTTTCSLYLVMFPSTKRGLSVCPTTALTCGSHKALSKACPWSVKVCMSATW